MRWLKRSYLTVAGIRRPSSLGEIAAYEETLLHTIAAYEGTMEFSSASEDELRRLYWFVRHALRTPQPWSGVPLAQRLVWRFLASWQDPPTVVIG
ncbi:unnamed protein product [Cyprideis torosa]|uniref:Uncharacterized protein n=1 Tax=Cyprideis torosa TaxID=163714 RepID=A0A7R8ZUB8_9CRUS|nr:unnamed protein product [Cyprideis torosa]CAG0900218.1 unnamed protein product [Cyprideis torosa]